MVAASLIIPNNCIQGVVNSENPAEIIPTRDVNVDTLRVLAGAHSLHMSDQGIIGDPLEIGILEDIEWTLKVSMCMCLTKSAITQTKLRVITSCPSIGRRRNWPVSKSKRNFTSRRRWRAWRQLFRRRMPPLRAASSTTALSRFTVTLYPLLLHIRYGIL